MCESVPSVRTLSYIVYFKQIEKGLICTCLFGGLGISGKTGNRTNIWSWQVDDIFQAYVKNISLELETLKVK